VPTPIPLLYRRCSRTLNPHSTRSSPQLPNHHYLPLDAHSAEEPLPVYLRYLILSALLFGGRERRQITNQTSLESPPNSNIGLEYLSNIRLEWQLAIESFEREDSPLSLGGFHLFPRAQIPHLQPFQPAEPSHLPSPPPAVPLAVESVKSSQVRRASVVSVVSSLDQSPIQPPPLPFSIKAINPSIFPRTSRFPFAFRHLPPNVFLSPAATGFATIASQSHTLLYLHPHYALTAWYSRQLPYDCYCCCDYRQLPLQLHYTNYTRPTRPTASCLI
jgi:hypothetical protein